jgi:hypothetical protein
MATPPAISDIMARPTMKKTRRQRQMMLRFLAFLLLP